MLRDVDRSLANWLGQVLPPGVSLRFDAPAPQWVTKPPEPLFVDAFLHSVTQDARGRQAGWSEQRDSDGRVVGRQPAPQFFRLAYLVTAWAGSQGATGTDAERIMAEHEVLGFVLNACTQYGVLPDDCLEGALAEGGVKTVLECAPADSPTVLGPLWSGLGLVPRAHLELMLIAPAKPPMVSDLAPPAREIVLNAADTDAKATGDGSTRRQPGDAPFGTLRRWEKRTVNER